MRYCVLGVNNYDPTDDLAERFAAAGHQLVWSSYSHDGGFAARSVVAFAVVVHNGLPPINSVWSCMERLARINIPPILMSERQLNDWLALETRERDEERLIRSADLAASRARGQSEVLERVGASGDDIFEDECAR